MPAPALDIPIAPTAKRLVARSGEHYHADVRPVAANVQRVEHLLVGIGAEGIIDLRTVDRYAGYAFEIVEQDVRILLDGSPYSLFCHGIFGRFSFLWPKVALSVFPGKNLGAFSGFCLPAGASAMPSEENFVFPHPCTRLSLPFHKVGGASAMPSKENFVFPLAVALGFHYLSIR